MNIPTIIPVTSVYIADLPYRLFGLYEMISDAGNYIIINIYETTDNTITFKILIGYIPGTHIWYSLIGIKEFRKL